MPTQNSQNPSLDAFAHFKEVLDAAKAVPMSVQLRRQQLHLYGKVCREGPSLLRQVALEPNDCIPKQWHLPRRVGRPRLQWSSSVFALALRLANGSLDELREMVYDKLSWHKAVKQFSV